MLGFISRWFGGHFGIDLESFRGGFGIDLESLEGHFRSVFDYYSLRFAHPTSPPYIGALEVDGLVLD